MRLVVECLVVSDDCVTLDDLLQLWVQCLSPLDLRNIGAIRLSDLHIGLRAGIGYHKLVIERYITVRERIHNLLDHGVIAINVLELRNYL